MQILFFEGKNMKKNVQRLLLCCLVFLVSFIYIPFGEASESFAESTLSLTQPAVILTGTDLIHAGQYNSENIQKEKIYSIEDLKAIAASDVSPERASDDHYMYSALNSVESRSLFLGEGVLVSSLFRTSGITDLSDKFLSVVASDKYEVCFDPDRTFPGTDAEDDFHYARTQGIADTRYYFPKFADDPSSEEGKAAVPAIIAWAKAGEGKGDLDVTRDSTVVSLGNKVLLMVGQLNKDDHNNPLYNGSTSTLTLHLGEKLTSPVFTLNGAEYTRAKILSLKYTDAECPNENGVIHARGIPMSVLLSRLEDDERISFTTTNGSTLPADGLSKKQLVDNDYILAYAEGDSKDTISPILESSGSSQGFFRLYSAKAPQNNNACVCAIDTKSPLAGASVKLSKVKYVCNNTYRKPVITVEKGYPLINNTDYTIKYANNKGIGTATVTVTGKGLYFGTIKKSFTIIPAQAKISKVTTAKRALTVYYKKTLGSVRYKVAIKQAGKSWKTFNAGTALKKKFTKLKSKKYYYIKVRAFKTVNGKTYYGSWSLTKKAKTK